MSGMAAGSRVMASWLGGGFAPGIAVEINPAAQLVKVRFDDGREAWVSNMNVRLAPSATGAAGAPSGFQPMAAPVGGGNFGAQSSYGAGGVLPLKTGGLVGGNPFAGLNPFGQQGAPPASGAAPMAPNQQGVPGAGGFLASAAGAISAGVAHIASFGGPPGGAPVAAPVAAAAGGGFNPFATPSQAPAVQLQQQVPPQGPSGAFNPFAGHSQAAPPPSVPQAQFNPFAGGSAAPSPQAQFNPFAGGPPQVPQPVAIPEAGFNPFAQPAPAAVPMNFPRTEAMPVAPVPPGASASAEPFNPFAQAAPQVALPGEVPASFNPFAQAAPVESLSGATQDAAPLPSPPGVFNPFVPRGT